MIRLNTIKAHPGAVKKRKRLGRGAGSGHGQTAGKGDKGQLARTGGKVRAGFEGGQTPLYRRIPKRGFKSITKRPTAIINVGDLDAMDLKPGSLVDLELLQKSGKCKGRFDRLYVLGTGELKRPLKIVAHKITAQAQQKIQSVGGEIQLITFD